MKFALVAAFLGGLWAGLLWHYGARCCVAVSHPAEALGSLWSLARAKRVAVFGGGSFLMVAAGLLPLWAGDPAAFAGDSLFTLAAVPRSGLVLLSGGLIYGLFWLSAAKSQALYRWAGRKRLPLTAGFDLLASGVLFLLAYALSPQLYYAYYRLVMPGLPDQWVIGKGSFAESLAKLTTVTATSSLADILAAASFWSLLVMALWCFLLAAGWVRRPRGAWWAGGFAALLIGLIHLAR